MALETVVYPHDQIGIWGFDYLLLEDTSFCGYSESNYNQTHEQIISSVMTHNICSSNDNMMDHWCSISSQEDHCNNINYGGSEESHVVKVGRRKRRRTKSGKNKEEVENQRMTHITVERNRRKQMNDYLAVIRSLMPSSYVHRGDQASIIGGAINFVKELEHQLQTVEVQKRAIHQHQHDEHTNYNKNGYSPPLPFGDFFTFPQFSTRTTNEGSTAVVDNNRPPAMAEIEVTMVENHANLKILSKKRNRQLLKMVAGLQCLWFTILHLNVTTVDHMVLYSLSVKLEDGCQLHTVDEIANAVNCILGSIEEDALT